MNDTNWQNLPNTTTPITAERLNKLDKVIEAPQTADLNDYTTTGTYHFSAGGTITNVPAGVNGWLVVLKTSDGSTKQIWFRQGTANTNDFETYVRTLSPTWSDWKRLITDVEAGTWTDISSRVTVGSNYTVVEKRIYANATTKLCQVHLSVTATSTSGDIASGLPKAPASLLLPAFNNTTKGAYYAWVRSAGTIGSGTTHSANNNIVVCGTYPYTSL